MNISWKLKKYLQLKQSLDIPKKNNENMAKSIAQSEAEISAFVMHFVCFNCNYCFHCY